MADMTAEQYVKLWDREYNKPENTNFRSLWQEVADLMYPLSNDIITTRTPGEQKPDIYDVTAKLESQNMASDLSAIVVPPGQRFFELEMADPRLNRIDLVSRYLMAVTDKTHDELFRSNFMLQLNESLRSLITFGTANLYSEFGLTARDSAVNGVDTALNFCDYPIGTYVMIENNKGMVTTMMVMFQYTASQAVEEWGLDALGQRVQAAYKEDLRQNDLFSFLHIVRPRRNRDVTRTDRYNLPYESVYIGYDDKNIIDEGGFEEFPFHVPRWMKTSSETNGHGQGTEILPVVKMLQTMHEALIDNANFQNTPALEILDTFEGNVKLYPGAQNYTTQLNSIKAIEGARGNFPITKDILEYEREDVRKAFFSNILNQLIDLKGDRRTTLEISERVKAGLKRLALPVARLYGELFNTLIPRCVMILMRNGLLPLPPAQIAGKKFNIKYVGPLALALRNQQAQAYKEWVSFVAQTSQFDMGAMDIVNIDEGNKELARAYGVKLSVIASDEEIEAKRQQRAQQMAAQQQMQMAEMMAKGYGQTSKKAEEGSLADEMMQEAANGA